MEQHHHHHHHHHQQQQQQQYDDQQIPIIYDFKINNTNNKQLNNQQQRILAQNNNNNNNVFIDNHRIRNYSDTDSSYLPETTSESGISDLDMNEKCNCCPYGFHIDTDFVNFLDSLDGKNLVRQLKKIQRKRNERLQRSMEYVIDEVEKIRTNQQVPPLDFDDELIHGTNHQMATPTSNIQSHHYYHSFEQQQQQQQQQQFPPQKVENLKKTISKIDQEISRNFDPKVIIEHHRSRHGSASSQRGSQIRLDQQTHSSPNRSAHKHTTSSSQQQHKQRSMSTASGKKRSHQYEQYHEEQCFIGGPRRSRSKRRTKSVSKSPDERNNQKSFYHHQENHGLEEIQTITQKTIAKKSFPHSHTYYNDIALFPKLETNAQEITLNVVSLANTRINSLASSESTSSASLNELDARLKINEVEPVISREMPQTKIKVVKRIVNNDEALLRKIAELERKLSKVPELEIKNSALLEERNLLLAQLTVQQQPQLKNEYRSVSVSACVDTAPLTRDVGIECKTNTRDVGILHNIEAEEEKKKFVEMATIISTLREKLDEQTLTMQKPQTRDVAIMHVVDKVEQEVPKKPQQRDVAINHRTENDPEVDELLAKQKQIITSKFVKELDILRSENVKLSSNLADALKKKEVHVTTRGTHAPQQPVLYSVGMNTQKNATRDVQVMFTPKCRDVSLGTDRFYYTRDVSLYCNLEDYEDTNGMSESSSLYTLKVRGKRVPKEYREVCIGVDLMPQEEPKVMRDVKIGVNLDMKELRDVSIGCLLDVKPTTRDVAIRVNLDERDKKTYRDVCIGAATEQKDACIFVNTIEPPKPQEKPQQRHVCMDTSSLTDYKDSCISTDPIEKIPARDMATDTKTLMSSKDASTGEHKTFSIKQTTTQDFRTTRDSQCDVIAELQPVKVTRRDFSANIFVEDEEKLALAEELLRLKSIPPKQTRDIGISNDPINRATSSLTHTTATSMEQPKLLTKLTNTDQKYTRDSFVNTDRQLTTHKACGDMSVSEALFTQVEMNQMKSKIAQLEIEKSFAKKEVPKPTSNSVAVGSDDSNKSFCESCRFKDIRSTGVGTATYTRTEGCVTDLCNINSQIGLLQNEKMKTTSYLSTTVLPINIIQENTSVSKDHESALASAAAHISKRETEFEQRKLTRIDGGKKLIKETITMSKSDNKGGKMTEVNSWQTTIDDAKQQQHQKLNLDFTSGTTNKILNDENMITQSTEEITYNKGGEIMEKRICEKMEIKPKSILKTSGQAQSTHVISKAIKFGGVMKSLSSASEESMSHEDMNSVQANAEEEVFNEQVNDSSLLEASVSYETSGVVLPVNIISKNTNEIDDFETQEMISSIKDEHIETQDPFTGQQRKSIMIKNFSDSQRFELELELHIACAILNDSLYEPLKADKTKVAKALSLIQQDWFKIAAQKDSNPQVVMNHLKTFYSRFSNLLLERIVNMADVNLNTALHYSVSQANFEIVNLLLDTNVCDVNAQNKAGYTSIMLSAVIPVTNDFERQTLRRLYSEGNVNIKSTDTCQTALMLAVKHGNKEAVTLLLESGADVNIQDKDGSTALMAACEHGYIDIVRSLLDNSTCDPDIKDNDGENAFDIAKNKKRNDIIVLLYAHSSKLRSHHPAVQFSKSRPRIGSASGTK